MATKTSRNGASQKSSSSRSQSGKKSGSPRESMGRHGRGEQQKSQGKGNGSSSSKASPEQGENEQEGVVSKATGGIREAGSKIYDTVRQHPIAASLVGAGITAGVAILAVRAIRGISDSQGEEEQGGEEGQDQMDSGDAEASSQGEEGQEGEDEGGEEEEGESDDEDDICSRGKFWQRHPLAIGAGLMGLGTAAGMLLPSTGIEKKLFGSASDKFTDRFKSAGQKLLKQGKQMASKVVSETGSALSEEAEREGLSPDKLATKVTRIAGRLKDVVAHAVAD